jgi:hypothetical protein
MGTNPRCSVGGQCGPTFLVRLCVVFDVAGVQGVVLRIRQAWARIARPQPDLPSGRPGSRALAWRFRKDDPIEDTFAARRRRSSPYAHVSARFFHRGNPWRGWRRPQAAIVIDTWSSEDRAEIPSCSKRSCDAPGVASVPSCCRLAARSSTVARPIHWPRARPGYRQGKEASP